jgi:sigma-B regulation protein RsbU (phosphoserine phosphatase)
MQTLQQPEDLVHLALSSVIIAVSLAALLFAALQRERRNLALAFFGCTFLLIGLRFLIATYPIRVLMSDHPDLSAIGPPLLTYLNGAAAFAFVLCHVGPGWRSSLRWVAWGYFGFASIAVVALFVHSDRELFVLPNNVVIIAALATIYVNAFRREFRQKPGSLFLTAGCVGGIVYFVLESLRILNLISFDIVTDWSRGLIFYCTLGVMALAMRYFFVREKDLAAIRQELKTARRIQTSILPQTTPTVEGLDIAAGYVPMTEVAGDFYDFVTMDRPRVGVLVADVSGHGVSAALIASMVKVALQARADDADQPGRLLAGMNRIFGGQLGSQFITAGYAFIDMEAGRIDYAGAAHPPLLVLPADGGDLVRLEENGLMLGQFPDATYQTVSRGLTKGDRIVMTTDGLVEATNAAGEQFGDERLPRLLSDSRGLPAEGLAEKLLAEANAWTDARQDDDLTLVVVDVRD